MAITLRLTATDTGGKAGELTHQEMNDNFKSVYYSSSLSGNNLLLFTTGSDTHSVDLTSVGANLYNIDGELTGNRAVNLGGNNLTFTADQGESLTISSDPSSEVAITDLTSQSLASVVGYNTSTGQLTQFALNGGIATSLIPAADETYDLGSATYKWRDLYLSGSTIYLGNTTISYDGTDLQVGGSKLASPRVRAAVDGDTSELVPIFGAATVTGGATRTDVTISALSGKTIARDYFIFMTYTATAEGEVGTRAIEVFDNGSGNLSFYHSAAGAAGGKIMYQVYYI